MTRLALTAAALLMFVIPAQAQRMAEPITLTIIVETAPCISEIPEVCLNGD